MARLAAVEKNNRKKGLVKRYYKHREELRRKSVSPKATEEERQAARLKLQKLPKSTSHTQIRHRCVLTGRPRGNFRKFGLCRLKFRELALTGKLPGVTKASW